MNKVIRKVMLPVILLLMLAQSANAMRQPQMERSLRALDNAERILKKALPNKGGHRAKALIHIRKAKQEIRRGIDFANRRAGGGQYKQKGNKQKDNKQKDNKQIDKKQRYEEEPEYREKEKVIEKRY